MNSEVVSIMNSVGWVWMYSKLLSSEYHVFWTLYSVAWAWMYSKLWVLCILSSVFCILLVGRGRGRARAYRKSHGERSMRDASSSNTPNKGQTQHYTSNIVLKGLRIIKVDNIWVYENWCIRGIQPALCWDGFRWIQIRWSGIVENTEEFVALCVEIRQAPLFLFTAMQTPATTQQVATWMEMDWRWQPSGVVYEFNQLINIHIYAVCALPRPH